MNPHTRLRSALLSLVMAPVAVSAQPEPSVAAEAPVEIQAPAVPLDAELVPEVVPAPEPVPESALPTETSPVTPPLMAEVAAEAPASVPATTPVDAPSAGLSELAPATPVAAVVPAAPEAPKDTLSVDFPDEDIRNILRNVADLFELNIVMPDTLQGRTSIKLRDVTWRQIFNVVLAPVGYTFVEDGNIIKIVTNESLTQEPLSTDVYILNYARAEEIKPSIDSLVNPTTVTTPGGRVQVDKRINALIISERPSVLAKILPVLRNLDKPTDQVMIESKFVEVNDTNVKNLGVNWSSLNNYQVGYSPVDTLLTGNDRARVGVNTGGVTPGPNPTEAGTAYGAVLTAPQFNVALRALQTTNNSRVVSNPTIVTLNNTPAEINVGEEYPIPSYTYNAERGSFEVSGFEYKPIGVLLKVTPQVNSQGFIRLNLEPEISVRGDPVSFGGASGAEIPIIRTRKTKTQVSMKDGHTLAIGGLIDSTSQKGQSKVPVLGNVPGLGRLFRSDTTDASKRNLLIFITSKVVSAESAPVQDVFSVSQVQDAGMRESDLPGHRSSASPFLPEEVPAPMPEKKSLFSRLSREKKVPVAEPVAVEPAYIAPATE
jgi:type IV pilus assembly protein PilQ